MYIGSHISKSNGYLNAVKNAIQIGANCMQIFISSPRKITFPLDKLTDNDKQEFKEVVKLCTKEKFKIYIHSPYIINLCDPGKFKLNTKLLLQELTICDYLNGEGVVIHTGSKKKDQTLDNAHNTYINVIKNILKLFQGKSKILLETSAGQGNSIGVSIEDFLMIYNSFTKKEQSKLGLVLDTCHIFSAGYDIRTLKDIKKYFRDFNKITNTKNIKLIHLNDTMKELNSHVDRHENIGKGYIFSKSLETIKYLKSKKIPIILETPDTYPYKKYKKEIQLIKNL